MTEGEEVVLLCVERRHIDDLSRVAGRLASGEFMDGFARKEAAITILQAVRFAEVLHALRGSGDMHAHLCPRRKR